MVLSSNVLTTFPLNFSQVGPGAADLELKCTCNSPIFYFWETEKKLKFGSIQVLWDYHTKGDTAKESTFFVTIGLWQLTWNRYKFLWWHVVNYSPVNKLLFHVWSQNSRASKHEIIFWFTILAFEILRIGWLILKTSSRYNIFSWSIFYLKDYLKIYPTT